MHSAKATAVVTNLLSTYLEQCAYRLLRDPRPLSPTSHDIVCPQVTYSVQRMEKELGVRLVSRDHRVKPPFLVSLSALFPLPAYL